MSNDIQASARLSGPLPGNALFRLDFDGGSLADTSANGLRVTHGTPESIIDGGYRLNGQHARDGGNYIAIERNGELFSRDQMSISLNFKSEEGAGGSLFRIHTGLHIDVTADGQLVFNLFENSVGESGVIKSEGLNVTDGEWHQMTVTYDAAAGVMRGYVDGAAIGEIAVSGPTKAAQSWDPMIGEPWGRGFTGMVDEFTISDRALTAEEVKEAYEIALGEPGQGDPEPQDPGQGDPEPQDPGQENPDPQEPAPEIPALFRLSFDDGALTDDSGSGLAVTHGLADSIVDGAYALNGHYANDGGNYIGVEQNAALFSRDEMSISLNFKAGEPGEGGSLFRIHTALHIDATDKGDVVFNLFKNSAGESGIIRSEGLNVTDGEWHQLTLTYDAPAGVMRGYVDGAAVGEIAISGATSPAESWGPMIGSPWGNGFLGSVDEFMVSDRALTEEEVSQLYDAMRGGAGPQDPGSENPGNEDPGNEDPGNENPGNENPGNEEPAPGEPPALSALFRLNFDGGNLSDRSGNGLSLTNGAPESIVDGAYSLNGKHMKEGGNYIGIERNDALFSKEQTSISLSFKSDSGEGGSLFRIHTGLHIDATADGQVSFNLFENGVGEKGVIRSEGLNVTDGEWHQVTLTYDASAGVMRGYVDGAEIGEIEISGPTKAAQSWDPMIGDPWGNGLKGSVDEFTISDRAFTGEEVRALHHAMKNGGLEDPGSENPGPGNPGNEDPGPGNPGNEDPGPQDPGSEPPDPSGSIIVSDSASFLAAVRNATGGETILLKPGNYSGLIKNVDPGSEVVIRSLDPNNPANITMLELNGVSDLTFRDLSFEYKGTPAAKQYDIRLTHTDNIRFTDSTFEGFGKGYAAPGAKLGQFLALVRESTNFTFDNNDVSGYMHGLSVLNSSRISIRDNDVHHMQGDGLRFGQVQHINIEDNMIREFYGADYGVTHGDYIQFWTTNTTAPSTDITIRGNAFLSGDFQSQVIFFRDQLGDTGKGAMRFQDILIEDNVIYNNQHHGITIPSTDGVIIRGNTLIIHPEPGATSSAITVSKSTGVQVYDNVAPRITVGSDNKIVKFDGNIDYIKDANFVKDQFVNGMKGSGATLADLKVDPSGSLMKSDGSVYGSEQLNPSAKATFALASEPLVSEEPGFDWAAAAAGQDSVVQGDEADFQVMQAVLQEGESVNTDQPAAVPDAPADSVLAADNAAADVRSPDQGDIWPS